jgi:8-oxo-dGTP pyrophosphatase MutT (NUDIX family)
LEHGETPIEAVRREIFEEAGARVKDATLHDVWSTTVLYHENGQDISLHHIGIIYKVDLFDADVIGITNQNEDVSDVDWYDIMLVNENQMTPFVYSEWQRFCNRSDRKIRHTS